MLLVLVLVHYSCLMSTVTMNIYLLTYLLMADEVLALLAKLCRYLGNPAFFIFAK